jgi:PTS system fructose-specific IIA component
VVKFGGDIEWKSMDDHAVKAAIALFVPGGEAGTTHLLILSKVAALLMQPDFCELVLESDDEAEIAAAIEEGVA